MPRAYRCAICNEPSADYNVAEMCCSENEIEDIETQERFICPNCSYAHTTEEGARNCCAIGSGIVNDMVTFTCSACGTFHDQNMDEMTAAGMSRSAASVFAEAVASFNATRCCYGVSSINPYRASSRLYTRRWLAYLSGHVARFGSYGDSFDSYGVAIPDEMLPPLAIGAEAAQPIAAGAATVTITDDPEGDF